MNSYALHSNRQDDPQRWEADDSVEPSQHDFEMSPVEYRRQQEIYFREREPVELWA